MRTTTLAAAGLLTLALLTTPAGAATDDTPTCRGEVATAVGTSPTVTGTDGDDVIVSGAATEIRGLGGDDSICVSGSAAASLLDVDAGAGDDVVLLEPTSVGSGSRVDAGEGEDALHVTHDGRVVLHLVRERLRIDAVSMTVTGLEDASLVSPVLLVVGDDKDNSFTFAGCNVSLSGGAGRDVLSNWTEDHDDDPFGCHTGAHLFGGPGADFLRGTHGDDRILAGAGRDRVRSRGGDDRVRGGSGRDDLEGGAGRDDLGGGAGRDSAHGGQDRDRCRAEAERHCER